MGGRAGSVFDSYRHDLTCCNAKSCVSVMHAHVVEEAAHNGKSTFISAAATEEKAQG